MTYMTDCTYINCDFFDDNFMWKNHQFGNIQGGKILEGKVQAAQSHFTLSPLTILPRETIDFYTIFPAYNCLNLFRISLGSTLFRECPFLEENVELLRANIMKFWSTYSLVSRRQ